MAKGYQLLLLPLLRFLSEIHSGADVTRDQQPRVRRLGGGAPGGRPDLPHALLQTATPVRSVPRRRLFRSHVSEQDSWIEVHTYQNYFVLDY